MPARAFCRNMDNAYIPKSNDFAGFALANAWHNLAEGVY